MFTPTTKLHLSLISTFFKTFSKTITVDHFHQSTYKTLFWYLLWQTANMSRSSSPISVSLRTILCITRLQLQPSLVQHLSNMYPTSKVKLFRTPNKIMLLSRFHEIWSHMRLLITFPHNYVSDCGVFMLIYMRYRQNGALFQNKRPTISSCVTFRCVDNIYCLSLSLFFVVRIDYQSLLFVFWQFIELCESLFFFEHVFGYGSTSFFIASNSS